MGAGAVLQGTAGRQQRHRQVPPGRGTDVAARRKPPAHPGPGGRRGHEELLATTTEPDGIGCRLTAFSEAYRRHEPAPELSGPEWEAVRRCLPPAVDALIAEALARSGAAGEDLRRERGGGRDPG